MTLKLFKVMCGKVVFKYCRTQDAADTFLNYYVERAQAVGIGYAGWHIEEVA